MATLQNIELPGYVGATVTERELTGSGAAEDPSAGAPPVARFIIRQPNSRPANRTLFLLSQNRIRRRTYFFEK
jgi:hypothetical protein